MLPDDEVRRILVKGLIDLITNQTDGRLDGCEAVGVVIEIDKIQKSYIFKYELETNNYGLIEIKYGSLSGCSIIYYHDENDDVIVKAALHGDGIISEDELKI